jgi:hypothetical protein
VYLALKNRWVKSGSWPSEWADCSDRLTGRRPFVELAVCRNPFCGCELRLNWGGACEAHRHVSICHYLYCLLQRQDWESDTLPSAAATDTAVTTLC